MVIDFHVYIGKSMVEGELSVEELLRQMENSGVDRAVLCPVKTMDSTYREQNAVVAQLQKQYPDQFYGYCRVDPNTGDIGLDVFRRGMEEQGLKGMLLHPWEDTYTVNDERVFPYVELALRYGVPVMIETGYPWLCHCFQVGDVAGRYPEGTFIMTHGGQVDSSGFSQMDAVKVIDNCPNIITETSGMFADEMIEDMANRLGPERLLFGSHSPWLDMRLETFRIRRAHISEDKKDVILGKNAMRLLGLEK